MVGSMGYSKCGGRNKSWQPRRHFRRSDQSGFPPFQIAHFGNEHHFWPTRRAAATIAYLCSKFSAWTRQIPIRFHISHDFRTSTVSAITIAPDTPDTSNSPVVPVTPILRSIPIGPSFAPLLEMKIVSQQERRPHMHKPDRKGGRYPEDGVTPGLSISPLLTKLVHDRSLRGRP
jgi:hypothetical protein